LIAFQKKFLKRWGGTDLEDGMKKLDKLTNEELMRKFRSSPTTSIAA
jgi:hypothetical protein